MSGSIPSGHTVLVEFTGSGDDGCLHCRIHSAIAQFIVERRDGAPVRILELLNALAAAAGDLLASAPDEQRLRALLEEHQRQLEAAVRNPQGHREIIARQ